MRTLRFTLALGVLSLFGCKSTDNKSQITGLEDTDTIEKITVVLYTNPEHCPPCRTYDPIFEKMKEDYEDNKQLNIYSLSPNAGFRDSNGNVTPEWAKFIDPKGHNITKGVPLVRVWIKNSDGKFIGDVISSKFAYKEFHGPEQDANIRAYIEAYRTPKQNLVLKNNFENPFLKTFPAETPVTVKGNTLTIGSETFEIIRNEDKKAVQLKNNDIVFDPATSTVMDLKDGSKIQAKNSAEGYIYEHCVDGNCRLLGLKLQEYTLFPNLTAKNAVAHDSVKFTAIKVETKVCGDTCQIVSETAILEDIMAKKYAGLSYTEVKAALEELKKAKDELKHISIPEEKK